MQTLATPTRIERVAAFILTPGDKVCDMLKFEGDDSRLILRMFVNLTIFSKLGVLIALAIVG